MLQLVRVKIPLQHRTEDMDLQVVRRLISHLNGVWFNKEAGGKGEENSGGGGAVLVGYMLDESKFELFNQQLMQDAAYSGVAFVVAFAITWVHTGSFFVTGMSFFQVRYVRIHT